jgi:hypothetical protein
MRTLLVTVFALAAAISSHAAPRINGAVKYEWLNNMASMALSVGMVDNSAGTRTSGTLQVKLIASNKPGDGSPVSGHVLASFKLEPLKAGQLYRDLRKVVTYNPPPVKGTYHLVMTLTEYTGTGPTGYVMVDYRNMSKTVALGPLEKVSIAGPWRWQSNYAARTLLIEAGKISHRRAGRTGSLKISVWATATPFRGGQVRGYELGQATKKGLEPGYSYTNFKATVPFTAPPNGTYFITLMVSEYLEDGYHMMDYLTSQEAATFAKP